MRLLHHIRKRAHVLALAVLCGVGYATVCSLSQADEAQSSLGLSKKLLAEKIESTLLLAHTSNTTTDTKKLGVGDRLMAQAVLEVMMKARTQKLNLSQTMELLASRFARWSDEVARKKYEANATSRKACLHLSKTRSRVLRGDRKLGPRWWACGTGGSIQDETDSGSLLRAWPVGVVFADQPDVAAMFAATQSQLTHRHNKARAACAALAVGVARALSSKAPYEITHHMAQAAETYDKQTALLIRWASLRAEKCDLEPSDVFETLKEGDAESTIALITYIFRSSTGDALKALYLSSLALGDRPTVASLAGALVGAQCGSKKLSKSLLKNTDDIQHLLSLTSTMLSTL